MTAAIAAGGTVTTVTTNCSWCCGDWLSWSGTVDWSRSRLEDRDVVRSNGVHHYDLWDDWMNWSDLRNWSSLLDRARELNWKRLKHRRNGTSLVKLSGRLSSGSRLLTCSNGLDRSNWLNRSNWRKRQHREEQLDAEVEIRLAKGDLLHVGGTVDGSGVVECGLLLHECMMLNWIEAINWAASEAFACDFELGHWLGAADRTTVREGHTGLEKRTSHCERLSE